MAAVAPGIDETSNTVQLNGFFGKHFIFSYNVSFSKCNFSATLPVYLFASLFVNVHVLSFYFQRWIFLKVLVWTLREL